MPHRLLFLEIFKTDSFFSDLETALMAGALQLRGIEVVRAKFFVPRACRIEGVRCDFAERPSFTYTREEMARLAALFQERRYDGVVLNRYLLCNLAAFVKELQPNVPVALIEFNPDITYPDVDCFVWTRTHDFFQCWLEIRRPPLETDLNAFRSRQPFFPGYREEYFPLLHYVPLNPGADEEFKSLELLTEGWCIYRGDPRKGNRHFKGISMEGLREDDIKGCSFCNAAEEPLFMHEEIVDLVLKQLRFLQEQGIPYQEFKVPGLRTLQYLDKVAEGIRAAGITGQTYLFEPRVDWLIKCRKTLERALEILRGTGNVIAFHLIGFENFSQKELDIYHKGVKVADNVEAVRLILQWGKQFPDTFNYDKYAAHGFIMFNPWTTMRDLRINLKHIRQLGFEKIREQPWMTKLRIYPNVPLYRKALNEGLVATSYAGAETLDNSQATGYCQETPWRFKDPRMERIYGWTVRLLGHGHQLLGRQPFRRDYLSELDVFEALVDFFDQPRAAEMEEEAQERALRQHLEVQKFRKAAAAVG